MSAFLRNVGKVSNAEPVSLKTRFGRRRVGGKLFRNLGPLRGVTASTGGDPYFANVVSLLHFDGADASTTFTDAFRTWTAVGNSQIDTAQSVFGGASGLFDGLADSLTTASETGFNFGSGDFTVEWRHRFANLPSAINWHQILVDEPRSNQLAVGDGDNLYLTTSGGAKTSDVLTISTNTWYAFAMSRVGNTLYFFQDGVGIGTADVTALTVDLSGTGTRLGGMDTGVNVVDGWLDELRVTKGVGRYNANYTIATAAFPDS